MNEKQAQVVKAMANAVAARNRLSGTVAALQSRLDRRTITRRTQRQIATGGAKLSLMVRANPAAAGGTAVIGVLLLLRRLRHRNVTSTHSYPRDRAQKGISND